jgi:hypothetical protein
MRIDRFLLYLVAVLSSLSESTTPIAGIQALDGWVMSYMNSTDTPESSETTNAGSASFWIVAALLCSCSFATDFTLEGRAFISEASCQKSKIDSQNKSRPKNLVMKLLILLIAILSAFGEAFNAVPGSADVCFLLTGDNSSYINTEEMVLKNPKLFSLFSIVFLISLSTDFLFEGMFFVNHMTGHSAHSDSRKVNRHANKKYFLRFLGNLLAVLASVIDAAIAIPSLAYLVFFITEALGTNKCRNSEQILSENSTVSSCIFTLCFLGAASNFMLEREGIVEKISGYKSTNNSEVSSKGSKLCIDLNPMLVMLSVIVSVIVALIEGFSSVTSLSDLMFSFYLLSNNTNSTYQNSEQFVADNPLLLLGIGTAALASSATTFSLQGMSFINKTKRLRLCGKATAELPISRDTLSRPLMDPAA